MDKFIEFAGQHTLLVVALMVSFFVLIFTELRRLTSGVASVAPNEAVQLINNDALVIDLRSAEAYSRGHIVNARNIPFEELDSKSSQIEKFKQKVIVTVCDAGTTATRAVAALQKSGFEKVYGIKGGMGAWGQAGFPVVTAKKTKSRK